MDFTPDPGLMAATVALIVGIVREVITWDSYRVEVLREHGLPALTGVKPGKHPTRNGWWCATSTSPRIRSRRTSTRRRGPRSGGAMSLRQIAHDT